MEEEILNPEISAEEDNKMQNVATARVKFKVHLSIFVIVNLILWVLFFTLFSAVVTDPNIYNAILKVFVCVTVVWLLLVVGHYCIAYKWNKTFVEKELKKLKKQRAKQLAQIEKLKTEIQKDTINQK